jgi:DNA-directed RNA polymerases I, II, and III subunit RPABC1
MDFLEKKSLFKVRKTVLEMLSDRNFIIPKEEQITFEEFEVKFINNNFNIYIDSGNDELGKIYIYFHNENKSLAKSELRNILNKLIETYEDENIKLIILLKEEKGLSTITKEITKEEYKNVEVFMNKYMMFNITHHQYVPQHIIMNEKDEHELLDKFSITKHKLPKILKSDPIAKYYGMKPNQICKIIRKSPEVGEAIYYRICK